MKNFNSKCVKRSETMNKERDLLEKLFKATSKLDIQLAGDICFKWNVFIYKRDNRHHSDAVRRTIH